ncbi:MAG: exodeoxyribonuclease VII small subunit [Halobacteriovoraceae bacterium]|nr:exodeoxyribonuclease VII small subunit [Peredibacter sp.]MBJ00438.1 exodeoxyribonuclease VII small subunit [Halobacteriovoraceae bacterium]|tara:strand:+ start:4301 stop:4519 length:219 start_codon:yes stop_codon:yes gene_type:complete
MSKQKKFETALEKLESIVEELEGGELGLDDSIKKFENGIKLYQDCRGLLKDAEKKISILTDTLKEEQYEEEN